MRPEDIERIAPGLGRRTFQVTERDVRHPRDVVFERVDPQAVKIAVRP
jgi:hypothetical protein